MAITAGTASFQGNGPAQSGQILAMALSGESVRNLKGTCTVTGDGASSSFDCNYIDGTKTLSFTPAFILCQRSGGAATATIGIVSCVPKSGNETKAFTVTTDANVNAATFIVSFEVGPEA